MALFSTSDTIVAIATPPGRGGVGIVRLSGSAAPDIAARLLGRTKPLRPRHATHGHVLDGRTRGGEIVDEVVATWFQAPHSFTTEDVVEISAHGSPVVLARIVDLALVAGARLAEPGEFTYRAFLHGRIDLVQAEAIVDVIEAVTPRQARVAIDQLEGTLTTEVRRIEGRLFELAARLEASLDFPEEGFHFIDRVETAGELAEARQSLEALQAQGVSGRLLREGGLVVIAGRPNAGKSSLFNALVGASRAIVTEIAGTTRDVLTERVDVGGIPVTLVDTAGLREPADVIEAEGIARTRQAQAAAEVCLWVVDRSDESRVECPSDPTRTILVLSKSDLPSGWSNSACPDWLGVTVEVSARSGVGLDALRQAMIAMLVGREPSRDAPTISNIRHIRQVSAALGALNRTEQALHDGATEELLLAELLEARQALEAVTGERSSDDLLREIFGRFCIGK